MLLFTIQPFKLLINDLSEGVLWLLVFSGHFPLELWVGEEGTSMSVGSTEELDALCYLLC